MQEIKSFRLSVWKPADFRKILAYSSGEAAAEDATHFNQQCLHEQIYQWDPGDIDIWACVEKSELMDKIKELMAEFAPTASPYSRNFKKFFLLIQLLREAKNNGLSFWSEMTETVEIEFEQINLRADPLLCLINHMEWIHRVFADVPNSSVVIR